MTAERRRAFSPAAFCVAFILFTARCLAGNETEYKDGAIDFAAKSPAPLFQTFLPTTAFLDRQIRLSLWLSLRSPDAQKTFVPGSSGFAQGASARTVAVGARFDLDDDMMGIVKLTSIRGGTGRAQPRIFTPRTMFDKPAAKVIQAGVKFNF